jgi:hypothetical protein
LMVRVSWSSLVRSSANFSGWWTDDCLSERV